MACDLGLFLVACNMHHVGLSVGRKPFRFFSYSSVCARYMMLNVVALYCTLMFSHSTYSSCHTIFLMVALYSAILAVLLYSGLAACCPALSHSASTSLSLLRPPGAAEEESADTVPVMPLKHCRR